jgi:hypothetical protein
VRVVSICAVGPSADPKLVGMGTMPAHTVPKEAGRRVPHRWTQITLLHELVWKIKFPLEFLTFPRVSNPW